MSIFKQVFILNIMVVRWCVIYIGLVVASGVNKLRRYGANYVLLILLRIMKNESIHFFILDEMYSHWMPNLDFQTKLESECYLLLRTCFECVENHEHVLIVHTNLHPVPVWLHRKRPKSFLFLVCSKVLRKPTFVLMSAM